tara:strand:+ start:1313 stop:1570 length:258 start_codon:yes stop_codon:yes gene_type:complete
MKVTDLIAKLQKMDPDLEVIMQKDSEGNGYSPLSGIDANGIYIAESTYSGDVYDASWSAGDACMDDEEWAEILARPRTAIMFPVN